jgi:hypothetical protein
MLHLPALPELPEPHARLVSALLEMHGASRAGGSGVYAVLHGPGALLRLPELSVVRQPDEHAGCQSKPKEQCGCPTACDGPSDVRGL